MKEYKPSKREIKHCFKESLQEIKIWLESSYLPSKGAIYTFFNASKFYEKSHTKIDLIFFEYSLIGHGSKEFNNCKTKDEHIKLFIYNITEYYKTDLKRIFNDEFCNKRIADYPKDISITG